MRTVSDIGISAEYTNYSIQNIVATYDLKRKLDLATIATHHSLEFEPELFPAVRYRIKDLKVTVNIFHTGKCTILGAKTVEIVSEAVDRIKDLIEDAKDGSWPQISVSIWMHGCGSQYVGQITLYTRAAQKPQSLL